MYSWDDHRYSAFDDTPLQLAAIAGTNSFFYTVTDGALVPGAARGFEGDQHYHFFDEPLGYLDTLIADDTLLCADFTRVYLAVRGVPFVLIPSADFELTLAARRLRECCDIGPQDVILRDRLSDQTSLAFVIPQALVQGIWTWFSGAQIGHIMAKLGAFALKHLSPGTLLVNASHELTEVVVVSDQELLFANHFRTGSPDDILYYVMAVLDELEIDRGMISVKCSGPYAEEALSVLRRGVPDCSPVSYPGDMPTAAFPGVEATDLMSVLQCAS